MLIMIGERLKMSSKKLLVILNDPTAAYSRCDDEDFLSEINPRDRDGNRYFDDVASLNWKDKEDVEYAGITSRSFLEEKGDARALMDALISGQMPFDSPLFEDIFAKEEERVAEISRELNPDVIRAFNTHFAAELGHMVSRELDIPLVVSAHDPSRLTNAIKYADSLVCISEDLAERSVQGYGFDTKKMTVIPDGIDTHRLFYPRDAREYAPVVGHEFLNNPRILSVGRIVPSKNIETLLEAVATVKGEVPSVKHIHLGNGSPEAIKQIRELGARLELDETSYFIGGIQKNQLPLYYSWADVYALPTLWEGLGRAQIEALSCGTPVVTTDDAPMNTIVKDGYNGFVVDPRNPTMLANRITRLLTNEDLRSQLGGDTARRSVNEYDIDNIMRMNCRNYDKVLSEHEGR